MGPRLGGPPRGFNTRSTGNLSNQTTSTLSSHVSSLDNLASVEACTHMNNGGLHQNGRLSNNGNYPAGLPRGFVPSTMPEEVTYPSYFSNDW